MVSHARKATAAAAAAVAVLLGAAVAAAAETGSLYRVISVDHPTDVGNLGGICSTEQARLSTGDERGLLIHRALSSAPCFFSSTWEDYASVDSDHDEVVLLKPEAIAESIAVSREASSQDWKDRVLSTLSTHLNAPPHHDIEGQAYFSLAPKDPQRYQVLHTSSKAIVLSLSQRDLAFLDHDVTFDTRIQRADFRPTVQWSSQDNEDEKPEPRFKKPKYNDVVNQIASSSALSEARILKDLRVLTGEDPQPKEYQEWHSRHSATYGARSAGKWIKEQMEASLGSINGSTCSFYEYSPYFAPNIVCNIPIASDETKANAYGHELPDFSQKDGEERPAEDGMVLISAHYDSRGTFGETAAPGGDDDGSGTGALLAIARAIGNAEVAFASPVQLVAFSGEEQGLVGSQKYAKSLKELGTPIKLAVQMDMLAYRKPGEALQLAFPDKLSTKSATEHITAIADIYAPQLEPGFTPACCSDHQSFWEQGYPATWVFERNGPIADPMYHNSGDLTNRTGYDTEQLAAIAKVVTATLLNVAGFYL